uniref:Uncharacterized protein n=1 Tax=Meloidogyne incognita TaxID=6306 RepID=A0A914NVK0_MELIC
MAIHLDSDRGKFEFNSEQHLRPILAQVSSDNSTKDEKTKCHRQTVTDQMSSDQLSLTKCPVINCP